MNKFKVLISCVIFAVFASIGFGCDDSSSNGTNSENSSNNESADFIVGGATYVGHWVNHLGGGNMNIDVTVKTYNDGTMTWTEKYSGFTPYGAQRVFEGKWTANSESKQDKVYKWFLFGCEDGSGAETLGHTVDNEGNVYHFDYDYGNGERECGNAKLQRQ